MATESMLAAFSESLADAVEHAAPSVVQVRGRRPVSGVVYQAEVVITNARALGDGDGLQVRRHDGGICDASLAGWDPATGLAVLRVPGLDATPFVPAGTRVRPGHVALAVARSWSNVTTASAGLVAVVGGPLATGRRLRVDEVIRTTAPMHEGFAGGAFLNSGGGFIGVPTAASIRGYRVVIPAAIAWQTAAHVLEHGRPKRGYLGLAGQPAPLSPAQQQAVNRDSALLVVGVTPDSPAARGGLLVGDLLLDVDGRAIESSEDLLDLLSGDRIGSILALRVLRGTADTRVDVAVGAQPER